MQKGVVWEPHSEESDFRDQGRDKEMARSVWKVTGGPEEWHWCQEYLHKHLGS